ncbi:sugar-transfer associated ATP-grasp domain-containing protein [Flavivirga aquimarina]|uniref:Sugar-transfer associated ATP-grasp domain-containing protein n=1 Tax=Flavivirga aquimarina TaxID=2027862 RepID=A0ABT8WDF7_9FLAO|nr:sugar-transfer associated ATP-grasp domain-containing protein [Flavivirga aquimarina]MDO5971185.1 sugar-transfer associated ATP-grasp domain-containing protein [Flavivirga aquimarina]
MSIYHFFKRLFLSFIIKTKASLLRFNLIAHYRNKIRGINKVNEVPYLDKNQKKEIEQYYKKQGYRVKLYWHQFFIASNKHFSVKYIPDDIFHAFVAARLNESKQWPSLLDKNLSEVLFKGYKQPQSVVKNINGFYYTDGELVSKKTAMEICVETSEKLVIKPSIESGGGRQVIDFNISGSVTTYKDLSMDKLLRLFNKDFIIQRVVSQNKQLKLLNASSLNTLRIMSYLKDNQVYILSTILRIGKSGKFTDNNSSGGMVCGIDDKGCLKEYGYYGTGKRVNKTESGFVLKGFGIPSHNKVLSIVKELHKKVPYFKIISWDIAVDEDSDPVLIEYNTYKQDIRIHQLANGPVFETVLSEFLEIGRGMDF